MQVAVSCSEVVSSLTRLVGSDVSEVQVIGAQCLGRFAAWQGVTQRNICTPDNAEVG